MKIKYKIKEIYNRIFLVTIKDQYDLGMTFCRLQEFYESSFKQFRGKTFTLSEFQRAYSKKFGEGAFTYPRDWAGFNVPGNVIEKFMSLTFDDWGNAYDHAMENIYSKITKDDEYNGSSESPYYLIAAEPKSHDTIDHEICHALYYLDSEYKRRADVIISELNRSLFAHFRSHLLSMGYSKQVITDEINAYICIDSYQLTDTIKMNRKERKNFTKIKHKLRSLFTATISVKKHNK
jgi:hypothetical protein